MSNKGYPPNHYPRWAEQVDRAIERAAGGAQSRVILPDDDKCDTILLDALRSTIAQELERLYIEMLNESER